MNKQKKKRNHWVPQAYLRGFAADSERRKIWTLSKNEGAPALRPINKVAVRFYLYAPAWPDGQRDYSFEDKLAGLETFFGEPPWKALATDFVDLSWEPLRKMIALLTAVMYLRNPRNLQLTHDMHREIVRRYSQFDEIPDQIEINGRVIRLDPSTWPSYRDGTGDDIKRMWLDQVSSAMWMAELLLNMRWSVICSETPVFITTANPVVPLHPTLRFRGIKDPETTLVFPLSPTRLLCLDNRDNESKNEYYSLRDNGGGFNTLLWRYAIENMFAHCDPHLICAGIA
jgi:Protein of unknown function (DUF4238)